MTVTLQQPFHVRNEGSGSEGQRGSSPAWLSDPVSASQLLASTSITGKRAFSLMFQSYATSYVTIKKGYAFGKLLPDPYYCYCARDRFTLFDSRRAGNLLNETSTFSQGGFHLMVHECGSLCSGPRRIPRNIPEIGPLSQLLVRVSTGLIIYTVQRQLQEGSTKYYTKNDSRWRK